MRGRVTYYERMTMKEAIERIDELLTPQHFLRHKAVWNRTDGSFVDVIDLQKSKSGDTFTIEAGVFHPNIYRTCWNGQVSSIVQGLDCVVRVRLGQLIDGKDEWWLLDDAESPADVVQKVSAHVLPFFDRMHSFEAMEQFLTTTQVTRQKYPPPIIYLAALKNEIGDQAGGCALLTELGETVSGAWRNRISEVAGRLRCP
jgi:hypothetical protein